jgi:glycerophosphoryl diester phosphodiesterase
VSTNLFFKPDKTRPLVLGHRGVPALHQENSVAGFRRAVELGIDGVEFDVFLTRDRRVVVFHDLETERLTGVKGRIDEMTWDEVSKLRLQRRISMGHGKVMEFDAEERIPLLEEVLAEFGGKLLMDIEMKPEHPDWSHRHTGTETAKVIRAARVEESVIPTSLDFVKLYYLERESASLDSALAYDDDTLARFEKWERWIPELQTELAAAPGDQTAESVVNIIMESAVIGRLIGATGVLAEHSLIDSDTVSKYHARGMVVGAYTLFPLDTHFVRDPTLDHEQVLARLASLGVDWVETDDPERAMRLLSR